MEANEGGEASRARDEGQLTAPRSVQARALQAALASDCATPGHAAWSPVVVLSYLHSGAERLLALLSGTPGFACTAGTGVVPLCAEAAAVWQRAEGADDAAGLLSGPATAAIRMMAAGMATKLLGDAGRQRWCETLTITQGPAAGTFLGVFPGTRFLCLHRSFGSVVRAALQANPWGLASPVYSPFVAAQPGSTVAALAAYWATHTAALLAFERGHPRACLRIRLEDLAGAPALTRRTILTFLGADQAASQGVPDPEDAAQTTVPPGEHAVGGAPGRALGEADGDAGREGVPVDQIPEPLLTQVTDLLLRLGYPPLIPDQELTLTGEERR